MQIIKQIIPLVLSLTFLGLIQQGIAKEKEETLVTVEGYAITNFDIDRIIVSSPMADSFPTMDEREQAGLRGDILIRLINLNLLYQEALALGLDKSDEYLKELNSYKKGYVFKQYMDKLRASIEVPKLAYEEMVKRLKGSTEALEAAISQYKAQQYKLVKAVALGKIRDQVHLKLYTDRITQDITDDVVLAEADGYSLKYADLAISEGYKDNFVKSEVENAIFKKLEIDLVSKVAEDSTDNLDNVLKAFERERLPAMLLAKKEKEWIPNTASAREYFKQHPKIGYEPEKRYISQIVFKDLDQARAIQKRIQEGESFHRMAKKYSVDPVGRKNAGQLGWVEEGSALPEIEAAIKDLGDYKVSDIIKSSLGYHLVLIEGRKLGIQRRYDEIYDQVNQAIMQSNLPEYINSLQRKYVVEFARPVEQKFVDASAAAGS